MSVTSRVSVTLPTPVAGASVSLDSSASPSTVSCTASSAPALPVNLFHNPSCCESEVAGMSDTGSDVGRENESQSQEMTVSVLYCFVLKRDGRSGG